MNEQTSAEVLRVALILVSLLAARRVRIAHRPFAKHGTMSRLSWIVLHASLVAYALAVVYLKYGGSVVVAGWLRSILSSLLVVIIGSASYVLAECARRFEHLSKIPDAGKNGRSQ